MAQLITTYSKELKEKIFVLKGEESYARTTDTLLDEILHDGERREDWNAHKEYMLLEFRIDVLRDLGASDIVLYDNDEILGVYPFELGTHSIEFKYTSPTNDTRLKLAYGVEHNIYARYMGNKQCLKSTSKSYSFYEPTPSKYDSSIELVGLSTNYDSGNTIAFTPTITAYSVENLELIVYVDGVENQKVRTDSTGKAPVSLTGLTDGKHTISVEFTGGDYSTATSTTMDISVGYLVRMTEYPSYIINNQVATVMVYAYDYLDKPATSKNVIIVSAIEGIEEEEWGVISEMEKTNSNGYATLNEVYITENKFKALLGGTYGSEERTIPCYNNVTITSLTASPTLVSSNYSSTITGTVSNVSSSVVVSLNQGIGEVTTDNRGNFTATYEGSKAGDVTVTASISNQSSSVIIEDVLQYWKANSTSYNVDYRNTYGSCTQLTNGWRCASDISDRVVINLRPQILAKESDFQLEYKIVSTSKSTVNISLGYHLNGYIQVANLKSGDRIKLVSVDGIATLYVNDVSKGTFNSYSACLEFVNDNIQIIVDEVKLKRI